MFPSLRRSHGMAAAALLVAALGTACSRAPRPHSGVPSDLPPPASPAPAAPASAPSPRAYTALREHLGNRDLTPLRDRRVALDPGHGGAFRGALGQGGLAEADVNLGVALALRDLLRAAGTEVLLTRETDRDLLTRADSSLGTDLAARVALVNAWHPDVFLSIHHNSTAPRDTSANETQTYYPVGRDGADLDLARAVHRHLVRNLEIAPARILPGNYRVLREATVPAILGEPSMISNPAMAQQLGRPEKQELEAQAYFLGLLAYFAGGDPRWQRAGPDTLRAGPATLVWRFAPGGTGRREAPGLDPTSVSLTLDGVAQPATLLAGGDSVVWQRAGPLADGWHRLVLRGRNLAGRAAPAAAAVWREASRRGTLTAYMSAYRTAEGGLDSLRGGLLTWEARDETGRLRPYRGGRLWWPHGRAAPVPLPPCPGGRGWLRVRPLLAAVWSGRSLVCERGDSMSSGCAPVDGLRGALREDDVMITLRAPPPWAPDRDVPGDGWRSRLALPETLFTPANATLADPTAPLLLWRRGHPFWIEADGAQPLLGDKDGHGPWDPWGAAAPDTLSWRPLLPELVGKTIVLDPVGGGADTDGSPGPSGVRGSDLNLAVARALAALLRGAGASVVLTREDERWVAPEAKLLQTTECAADLYLAIRRATAGEPPFAARYHETSARGRRWARLFARAAAPLAVQERDGAGTDSLLVAPAATYLLRQTACPALETALPPPASIAREDRLERPDHQAACARALLLAVASLLASERILTDALDPAALMASLPDLFPPPARVAWARLDGNLTWLPPRWCFEAGDSVSSGVTPGLPCAGSEHTLEVRTGDGWRLVALRRAPHGFVGRQLLSGGLAPSWPEKTPLEIGRE